MKKYILYAKPVELKPLVSHVIAVGKSGSGKSNSMESYFTKIYDTYKKKGWPVKMIDIFDDGRFENAMYPYEEDDPDLLKQMHIYKRTPKSYPSKYHIICGNNLKFNADLPKNFILSSFNIESLRLDDIFYLFATSDKSKEILTSIAWKHGSNITLKELVNILKYWPVYGSMKATKISLLNKIINVMYSGIFSEDATTIDFKEVLQDTEHIACFNTKLVELEYKGLVYGLIMKQIFETKRNYQHYPNVKVYYRELAPVLGRYADSRFYMVRKQIENVLREGRDYGLDFIGDTQRVLDLDTWARTQFGLAVQLRSDYVDAEKFLQFMGEIPKNYLLKIPNLEVGTALVCIGGEWHYPAKFAPAPIRHKRARSQALEWLKEKEGITHYDPELYLKSDVKEPVDVEEMQAKKKKPKKQTYHHNCVKCSYEWDGYSENPKKCPDCQSKYWK